MKPCGSAGRFRAPPAGVCWQLRCWTWSRGCAGSKSSGSKTRRPALLLRIAPATIDRRLAGDRAKLTVRGRSHTKHGSLLKDSIPMRTWAEWDDARPGFVEIDLVGHEGGNSRGDFCFTLYITDIATGWTETVSVKNKAQKWVFAAIKEATAKFPFLILGIDSDYAEENANPRNRAAGHVRWGIVIHSSA